jgi:hypothetical protein
LSGTDADGNDFNNCASTSGGEPFNGRTADMACCACGGGVHVTNSPSISNAPTPIVV